MAEKKPLNEENKKETKNTQKKIATGNTKKAVSTRKSSVAGKAGAKKTSTTKKTNTAKKASSTKSSTAKTSETKLAGTTTKATKSKKTGTSTTKKTPKKLEENVEVVNEVANVELKENKPAKKSTTTKKAQSTKSTAKKADSKNKKVEKEAEPKEQIEKLEEKVENIVDVEKDEKVSIQPKKQEEITEVVSKELKANRKMPKIELDKINSKVFPNIVLAVAIVLYLIFIILGFMNIESNVFVTDLKVFSIALLIVSIGIFEFAYKKDSSKYAIHGIEVLLLAFITMTLIYVNLIWSNKLIGVVAIVIFAYSIYYVAKSIIIYNKMKKQYFMNEMKEIIKNK